MTGERILCSFPGRAGDLIWALPTVRAISETVGHPVDLQIAGEFKSMSELLALQSYLGLVFANPLWGMDTWEAPGVISLDGPYDRVIHLGYRRWPERPLPEETYLNALEALAGTVVLPPLDLDRPWITVEPWRGRPHPLTIGWTDCHFELKYGLTQLLSANWRPGTREFAFTAFGLAAPGSRWVTEADWEVIVWLEAARRIAASAAFLGDCSALHVLACALGKPCVIVEPMEARWNPIFYPYGMDGRVRVVKGLDGKPTFDARHTAETLREVLHGQ